MQKAIAIAALSCLALAHSAWAAKPSSSQPELGSPACTAGGGASVTAFIDCAGSFSGNLGGALTQGQIAVLNTEFGDKGFSYGSGLTYSKSDATGHGLFTDLGDDFTLSFDGGARATGLFVIGLKQANTATASICSTAARPASARSISMCWVWSASRPMGCRMPSIWAMR
ncbi:hypothetical protein [Paucibacter sp. M5-1]|uniref:hypothetical protein n=1 Tax=Paucibacter sp. M5-1 TaxID=3015998 RepID=UPI0022B88AD6|nr:hypothetical protein [Paucibacter sp. M5-1]MCZ7882283.1 hypothetical protein [Paucibacter sp. M5-1]